MFRWDVVEKSQKIMKLKKKLLKAFEKRLLKAFKIKFFLKKGLILEEVMDGQK